MCSSLACVSPSPGFPFSRSLFPHESFFVLGKAKYLKLAAVWHWTDAHPFSVLLSGGGRAAAAASASASACSEQGKEHYGQSLLNQRMRPKCHTKKRRVNDAGEVNFMMSCVLIYMEMERLKKEGSTFDRIRLWRYACPNSDNSMSTRVHTYIQDEGNVPQVKVCGWRSNYRLQSKIHTPSSSEQLLALKTSCAMSKKAESAKRFSRN